MLHLMNVPELGAVTRADSITDHNYFHLLVEHFASFCQFKRRNWYSVSTRNSVKYRFCNIQACILSCTYSTYKSVLFWYKEAYILFVRILITYYVWLMFRWTVSDVWLKWIKKIHQTKWKYGAVSLFRQLIHPVSCMTSWFSRPLRLKAEWNGAETSGVSACLKCNNLMSCHVHLAHKNFFP